MVVVLVVIADDSYDEVNTEDRVVNADADDFVRRRTTECTLIQTAHTHMHHPDNNST